jgi:hypothetical protein
MANGSQGRWVPCTAHRPTRRRQRICGGKLETVGQRWRQGVRWQAGVLVVGERMALIGPNWKRLTLDIPASPIGDGEVKSGESRDPALAILHRVLSLVSTSPACPVSYFTELTKERSSKDGLFVGRPSRLSSTTALTERNGVAPSGVTIFSPAVLNGTTQGRHIWSSRRRNRRDRIMELPQPRLRIWISSVHGTLAVSPEFRALGRRVTRPLTTT